MGESVLQDSLRPAYNNKLAKPVGIILVIWLIAMGSLLGVHYLINKKPQIIRPSKEVEAKYNGLNDEQKIKARYFEIGVVILANGNLNVVGSGFEDQEKDLIARQELSIRKIEFQVTDPLFLERQMMIKEAFNTLNNAEKHCVLDMRAIIIFRDGAYHFLFDRKNYTEYVSKYGTECESCGDKKNKEKDTKERRKGL